MELGESVSVEMIDDDDWECPFEHDKPATVDNDLGTSSSKLGTRLGNGTSTQLWDDSSGTIKGGERKDGDLVVAKTDACPPPHEVQVDLGGGSPQKYPYSIAAHHLIPGEASLPKSSLIDYIKGGKVIDSDVGYGVNGAENGIWLPTHTALSANMPVLPGESAAVPYAGLKDAGNETVGSFVHYYTYAVMEATQLQFHDDHTEGTDYSNFVVKVLNKIQSNLAIIKNYNCEKCQKAQSNGGKLPPPYRLVHRLNGVSKRLHGYLVGNPLSWLPPVFTSQHAESLSSNVKRLRSRDRL